jgi:hypothetical protein
VDENQAAQWRQDRASGEWRYIALRSLKLGVMAAWFIMAGVLGGLSYTYGTLPWAGGNVDRVVAIVFVLFTLGGAFRAWATWASREREYEDYQRGSGTQDRTTEV